VAHRDRIAILSICPPPPFTRGVPIELTIDVAVDLQTADVGDAMIGFNTEDAVRFKMVDNRRLQPGVRQFTFVVTVTPIDWGDRGDFSVMVNMGPERSGAQWRSTASDRRALSVEP
jgi:hypothetical protein